MKILLFIILVFIIVCTLFSILYSVRLRFKMLKSLDTAKFLTNIAKAERIFYENTLNGKLKDYEYLNKYAESTISALNYYRKVDDLNSVDNQNILNERIKGLFEKVEISRMREDYRNGLTKDLLMSKEKGETDLIELFGAAQSIVLYGLKQKGELSTIKKIKPLQNLWEFAKEIYSIARYKLTKKPSENVPISNVSGVSFSSTVYQN